MLHCDAALQFNTEVNVVLDKDAASKLFHTAIALILLFGAGFYGAAFLLPEYLVLLVVLAVFRYGIPKILSYQFNEFLFLDEPFSQHLLFM